MSIKESFVLYKSFYAPIEQMTDAQMGALFRAVFKWQISNEEPSVNSEIFMPFQFFKNQFNLDDVKYQKICERNKSNGNKGGRPTTTQKTQSVVSVIKKPRKPDNDNDNDNDTVNDNETDNEIDYPFKSKVFVSAWKSWREYKRTQFKFTFKSSMSEQTALLSLQKLSNGIESDALKIMEQSVANGWKGFFAIKTEIKKSTQPSNEYLTNLKNRING